MHEFAAVLEPVETPSPVRRDELGYRLRQQSLLGEFGRTAMQTRDLREILQRATELCATGLQAAFAKVLEYEPDGKRLMVRAGGRLGAGHHRCRLSRRRHWIPGRIRLPDRSARHFEPPGGR